MALSPFQSILLKKKKKKTKIKATLYIRFNWDYNSILLMINK